MKFALMMDMSAIGSYYVKDNISYGYHDDKPYTYHHSFSPECYLAMHNLPFIFDFGAHINWIDYDELPNLDIDVIFYDKGKIGLDDENYDRYHTDILRKKYPNAKIAGYIKELWQPGQNSFMFDYPGYLKHKSAFILPHLGSATKETRTAMANLAIDNLEEFFKSGSCKNKVN